MDNLQECSLCHDVFPFSEIKFDGINYTCPKCDRIVGNLSEVVQSEIEFEKQKAAFSARLRKQKQ